MATRNLLREAVVDWRSQGGGEVAFESVGGIDALRRIEAGEALDIAVLAADAIERLVAAGRIVADSTKPLARSKVAIAVAAGAPRPAIDSIEALRDSVLAARSIGYSTGPSGVALQRMFERWGIVDAVRTRLVVAPPMSSGSFIPWRSISRATCVISSSDGVIKPESPIRSAFTSRAFSRIFSHGTITPMSMTS